MQSIEELVEEAGQRIGHGVSLEDLDGLLLAYSSNQADADPVRVRFLLAKRVPADVASWQRSHGIEDAVRPVVIPANPALGMRPRVCVPLLERGFRVGYFWVQLAEEDEAPEVLDRLAAGAGSTALLAQRILDTNTGQTEHRRAREAVFLGACHGRPRSAAELEDWPEIHGTGPWILTAMTLLEPSQETAPSLGGRGEKLALSGDDVDIVHRTSALQATLGRASAVFSAGDKTCALVLVSAEDVAGLNRDVRAVNRAYGREAAARGSVRGARLVVGRSGVFRSVHHLPQHYGQAVAALQGAAVDPSVGERWGQPGVAGLSEAAEAPFSGLGVYQFLAGTRMGQSPVHSSHVTRIARQEDGAELLALLEAVYDRNESVTAVAERLHVHRSSVYNKLGRVRELIGVDPLHGPVRLEIHLALKAMRWERRPRL
ncbi:helix-turn-helix domain-containing protein [Falsarthrobacter nasiphocae]|uniref:PucR C-terminal helix-turn-helix domain-containing protein n=1 Tax=Falsarthrobacter nasiphocae TaxID=189863 RepID=A0AAE3YF97_9MICC|nr:helix-turn-helix domain-containing protein [Falsarthrobacter nasiphocae]MDR6892170.1 hypothetical protein [Falsarthrobacter nasiphocae]